jgi:hypothetical protein
MSKPMTVGEKVDRDGACEALLKCADLAKALGRLPVGEWVYTFTTDVRWTIAMNGGQSEEWTPPGMTIKIPRFYAYAEYGQLPVGLFNAAGGTLLYGGEDELIAALDREIHAKQACV